MPSIIAGCRSPEYNEGKPGREQRMSLLNEEWLTVEEVAAKLKVSEETVRRWIRAKKLPVLDLGGPRAGYRIRPGDLEKFLTHRFGNVGKAAA
jgi:excisionase family DNA binding protein